jgi:hypothetical protein
MSLFAIGQYGVPVAMAGITYVILATPWLLARKGMKSQPVTQDAEDVLLPARLSQWSPAAGRTIQRSGLRGTGGIYLVRVKRRATGNVHHAVGPEFVLQVAIFCTLRVSWKSLGSFAPNTDSKSSQMKCNPGKLSWMSKPWICTMMMTKMKAHVPNHSQFNAS